MEAIESTILAGCLGLAAGERFTVLADDAALERALAMHAEARRLGAESTLVLQHPLPHNAALDGRVVAVLGASDVIVGVCERSISHADATRRALARGARVVSMGAATEDVLRRLLGDGIDAVGARSRTIARALSTARTARITCPLGTDVELTLEGRSAVADDGDLRAPGSLGNMPFGEGFIAPTGGEGVVVPTIIAGYGRLAETTVLEVRDGRLAGATGAAGRSLCAALDRHGPAGRNLAELGIGAHHAARLTDSIVEGEKALGSAHVAFGASASFGGTVSVAVHVDCVVADAAISLDGRQFDPATEAS